MIPTFQVFLVSPEGKLLFLYASQSYKLFQPAKSRIQGIIKTKRKVLLTQIFRLRNAQVRTAHNICNYKSQNYYVFCNYFIHLNVIYGTMVGILVEQPVFKASTLHLYKKKRDTTQEVRTFKCQYQFFHKLIWNKIISEPQYTYL